MIRPLYLLFVLLVSSIAVAASQADQTATEPDSHHRPSLQEVLNNIDESKIHHALHLLSDKFRHGVFPTDTNAVEALHKKDASLAARLMKIAKRQQPADNSTSSAIPSPSQSESTPPPTSSQIPSTTKSETTPPESTSPSTTTPEPTTPSSTTEPSSPPPTTTTTSTTAPSTTSEKPTETTTTSSSSSSSSSSTESPSPTTFSTSSTKQETTPSPTTTKKPSTDSEPYTSTYESTTTLPNGDLKTVTAVTVVYPTPTGTTTAAPGLQTGAAAATAGLTKEVFAIVGGAVAVAMAL